MAGVRGRRRSGAGKRRRSQRPPKSCSPLSIRAGRRRRPTAPCPLSSSPAASERARATSSKQQLPRRHASVRAPSLSLARDGRRRCTLYHARPALLLAPSPRLLPARCTRGIAHCPLHHPPPLLRLAPARGPPGDRQPTTDNHASAATAPTPCSSHSSAPSARPDLDLQTRRPSLNPLLPVQPQRSQRS